MNVVCRILFSIFLTLLLFFCFESLGKNEHNIKSTDLPLSIVDTYRKQSNDDISNLNDDVEVTIQFSVDTPMIRNLSNNSLNEDKLSEYRQMVKKNITIANKGFIDKLSLENYKKIDISHFAPFVRYTYEDYDCLQKDKGKIDQFVIDNNANRVYISNSADSGDLAVRNDVFVNNYPFDIAKTDSGILGASIIDGEGIKIGILESFLPNNTSNLVAGKYSFNGITTGEHSFQVSSILGGISGIASAAHLYFSSTADYGFLGATNYLINQGVNIINVSWQVQSNGLYNANSAFLDYISRSFFITIVVASGNSGDSNITADTSNGLNTISVGSIDINQNISYFSSAGVNAGVQSLLRKPMIVAPGGKLVNIPNINDEISGTSFAAPFVSGIIALLMHEFPDLKYRPNSIMLLLIHTATKLPSQVNDWDFDAGAGLVSYNDAVSYCESNQLEDFFAYDEMNQGDIVYSTQFSVTDVAYISYKWLWLYNSSTNQPSTNLLIPHFTQFSVQILDSNNNIVKESSTTSNFSFDSFVFQGNGTYTLNIVMSTNKIGDLNEIGAIIFKITDHNHYHDYLNYSQYNLMFHKKSCECDYYKLDEHDWELISYQNGNLIGLQQFCSLCEQYGAVFIFN